MFQIWQDPKSGVGGLFGNLEKDEQEALRSTGLEMKLKINTNDKDTAQKKFIEWCHQQCPDAKVERCSFFDLKETSCQSKKKSRGGRSPKS